MKISLNQYEVWFVTGSQHLYGEETLKQVAEHSKEIASTLDKSDNIPVKVIFKPVLTTPDSIYQLCLDANSTKNCVGIIAWMHTFSPAKMWIGGLKILQKPMLHFHTQYNRDIPWSTIDMDFMNLNQSAHGGREFGFINTRMRLNRKVVVGHWQDSEAIQKINIWARVACAKYDMQGMKIARFGDNMRQVAVTEGDKVSAQIKFGYEVHGYGLGDLVAFVNQVSDADIKKLTRQYDDEYDMMASLKPDGAQRKSLEEAARIELGIRTFLEDGGFKGYTDTFENLHGLAQLPGIASQRLMAAGYGFGAEGDWKTAALVRSMKVMAAGMTEGTSFMEDYTYHFKPGNNSVLGSHMLEICPSIASGKPSCQIHPLGIGGKADPVRLVFDSPAGDAINASIIDMGDRFRLLVNEVKAIEVEEPLPKLPVARVLWKPMPDLKTAAAAWILAGGAHHTGYSQAVNTEFMEDFADMFDLELTVIDENTNLREFKNQLKFSDLYYHLRKEY
jgi:L-arabinose isomerase